MVLSYLFPLPINNLQLKFIPYIKKCTFFPLVPLVVDIFEVHWDCCHLTLDILLHKINFENMCLPKVCGFEFYPSFEISTKNWQFMIFFSQKYIFGRLTNFWSFTLPATFIYFCSRANMSAEDFKYVISCCHDIEKQIDSGLIHTAVEWLDEKFEYDAKNVLKMKSIG